MRSAQVFFGLWLAPMGYLAYKSGMFPRALGVVLVGATVSYLGDLLAAFLAPDLAKQIHPFLAIVPAIAEIWMVVYLLVIGVRSSSAADRPDVAVPVLVDAAPQGGDPARSQGSRAAARVAAAPVPSTPSTTFTFKSKSARSVE